MAKGEHGIEHCLHENLETLDSPVNSKNITYRQGNVEIQTTTTFKESVWVKLKVGK